MSKTDQLSTMRKYWGWGHQGFTYDPKALEKTLEMLQFGLGVKASAPIQPIPVEELELPTPRFSLPDKFAAICQSDNYHRANHSYGKAFRDVWRALRGQFSHPPDYVAYPKTEEDILKLLDFAVKEGIAVIPYGGGSSVVGGVEPRLSDHFNGCISLDMRHFDQVLEVDKVSRCAKIQAGIFGPALENQLRPYGYTLRHYPQSFEFSTLGGWIATRSGGHFATLFTHTDEFVQSIRMVYPGGVMETRRLPGSGAGPSEEQMILGSEGIFGIITAAWMRLQEMPKFKKTNTISFPDWENGVEACRLLAQSGLFPTNARLISAFEAMFNRLGEGQDTLILGFESHQHEVDSKMEKALAICKSCGGVWKERPVNKPISKRDAAADEWKKSFLQAPYMRDELVRHGFIVETFETAVTWDQFPSFHRVIEKKAKEALEKVGSVGMISCRFTHLYPDGPAPYYTIIASGTPGKELEQWDRIKSAVSHALIEQGGTITHHHSVGRDHQPFYQKQHSDPFGDILRSIKKELDPKGILNPGVLIRENFNQLSE